MTPDQIATHVLGIMQDVAGEQTSNRTIDESVAFLDLVAAATIKQLKRMRDDIRHSEPWDA